MMPAAGSPAGTAAAFERILEACIHAGAGQFQDLLGFRRLGDGETALRGALVAKTAHHSFAAPFAAGLLLANAGADIAPAIAWGEHIGVAFQATDDLTDLIASPAETGKDGLRDLLLGRPSLPLFLLRERVSGDDRAFLESIVGKAVVELGERAHIDSMIEEHGIAAACAERIRGEIAAADAVADAAGFPGSAREGMRVFERSLLEYASSVIETGHGAS